MNPTVKTFALATALGLGAGASLVHAQSLVEPGFYASLGYYEVNPQSDTGRLAGTFRSDIKSDSEPTVTLGYRFDGRWSAEAWLPIIKFKHDVTLDGVRAASVKHMPYLLTAQFHFLPDSQFQPFIGAGWGWVDVTGERTTGPLAGTHLNVRSDNGFVGQAGLDFFATPHVFVRADARYFDWQSRVRLDGSGIGKVKVNPWIYGLSLGYQF